MANRRPGNTLDNTHGASRPESPTTFDPSLVIETQLLETVGRSNSCLYEFSKGAVIKNIGQDEPLAYFIVAGSVSTEREVRTPNGVHTQRLNVSRTGEPFNYSRRIANDTSDERFRFTALEDGTKIIALTKGLMDADTRVNTVLKKRLFPVMARQCAEYRDAYSIQLEKNLELRSSREEQALSSTGAFLHAASSTGVDEELAKTELKAQLDEEVEAHNATLRKLKFFKEKSEKAERESERLTKDAADLREEFRVLNDRLKEVLPLARANANSVYKQHEQDERIGRAINELSNFFFTLIKREPTDAEVDKARELIQAVHSQWTDGEVAMHPSLHGDALQLQPEQPAPSTSRSRLSDPDVTAPRRMPDLEQATGKRSSPPTTLVPAPSTVQHGPRRPSLQAFGNLVAKNAAPPTQRALAHTPAVPYIAAKPTPIAKTLVPNVPHSAMPPTVEAAPVAKKGPPPLPKPAQPPRPATTRKQTPPMMEETGPQQMLSKHKDPSLMLSLRQNAEAEKLKAEAKEQAPDIKAEEPAPETKIGLEPVASPRQPFQPTHTPERGTVRKTSAGSYCHIAPSSETTLHGVGPQKLHLVAEEDEANDPGRPTMDIIPEVYRAKDAAQSAPPPNPFGVPSLVADESPKPREVTRKYYSPIPKPPKG